MHHEQYAKVPGLPDTYDRVPVRGLSPRTFLTPKGGPCDT
jgi:hypothetical protein